MGNLKENLQRSRILIREIERSFGFENDIKWGTVAFLFVYHAWAVYWCYHYAVPVKWQTVVFALFMYVFNGIGVIAGVHRYWLHRAFKAVRPLEILFLIMFASAGLTSVYSFVRNHRVHHKCSDTRGDPHDATRGFFYSHCGWLMMKKNKEVLEKSRTIDYSDIISDPLLMWHERHVLTINTILCFIIPTMICRVWGESWPCAIAWQCCIRYLVVMHCAFSINSFTHKYGERPYNKSILPAENLLISLTCLGEGFHNFHHTFPFDYRAADRCLPVSLPTFFIEVCAKLGLIWDLKVASKEADREMNRRLGDGDEK